MHTQTWWISGKILGSAPCRNERTCNEIHAPRSYAWCCPLCGEVWARRIISPATKWFFWTGQCEACASAPRYNSLRPPGSIWYGSDETYLANLPHFMYRYEAELTVKYWGR